MLQTLVLRRESAPAGRIHYEYDRSCELSQRHGFAVNRPRLEVRECAHWNLPSCGVNSSEALGEVRRVGKALRRQSTVLAVVNPDLFAHCLAQLVGDLRIASAEVPNLRRHAAHDVQG